MGLILTFAELDKLYEAANNKKYEWSFTGKALFFNRSLGRDDIITINPPDEIRTWATSKESALNNIKCRIIKDRLNLSYFIPLELFDYDLINVTELLAPNEAKEIPTCSKCGYRLNNRKECPICDLGEDDLKEGVFDQLPNRSSWVPMKATSNSITNLNNAKVSNKPNVVTIVYDNVKHKLRAQADDGIHGKGWVAFPSSLRTSAGQQYEVEQLIWNGKNYRVSGDVTPIVSAHSANINETINKDKENYKMNFQTILEELDKLYEEVPAAESKVTEEVEDKLSETCDKSLIEAEEDGDELIVTDNEADEEDVEIEIVDDEAAEEPTVEETQLVLECANCGALMIKAETDVAIDEESGIANIKDTCQFCDEVKGYKVIGTFMPNNEVTASVEELESEATAESLAEHD